MYAKLFSRITESSLMEEPIDVRYTFVLMLAIADPEGYVIGTDVAIARRLNMTVEQFVACRDCLMAPDPHSNSKDEDGRRLVNSEGERGYRIVNFRNYRDMKTPEDRRIYMRDYMRDYRKSSKETALHQPVNSVNNCKPPLALLGQAEAEAEAEEKENSKGASAPVVMTADEFFDRWNKLAGRVKQLQSCRKLTDKRRKQIRTRLNKPGWFTDFVEAVRMLPLGGDGWQPTLDWMIKSEHNIYRILEGAFDWRLKDDPAHVKLERDKRRRAAEMRKADEEKTRQIDSELAKQTRIAVDATLHRQNGNGEGNGGQTLLFG